MCYQLVRNKEVIIQVWVKGIIVCAAGRAWHSCPWNVWKCEWRSVPQTGWMRFTVYLHAQATECSRSGNWFLLKLNISCLIQAAVQSKVTFRFIFLFTLYLFYFVMQSCCKSFYKFFLFRRSSRTDELQHDHTGYRDCGPHHCNRRHIYYCNPGVQTHAPQPNGEADIEGCWIRNHWWPDSIKCRREHSGGE